jgi:hypothetical protein
MRTRHSLIVASFLLSLAPTASAQVVRGMMTVTGAEMH